MSSIKLSMGIWKKEISESVYKLMFPYFSDPCDMTNQESIDKNIYKVILFLME